MAKDRGTAADILLILLALLLLSLALSGNASTLLHWFLDWLLGKTVPAVRYIPKDNTKNGNGKGTVTDAAPAPAMAPAPAPSWSPKAIEAMPGDTSPAPATTPAPAPATKDTNPKLQPKLDLTPTYTAGILAALGGIFSQIGSVASEIPLVP